eukprot:UN10283
MSSDKGDIDGNKQVSYPRIPYFTRLQYLMPASAWSGQVWLRGVGDFYTKTSALDVLNDRMKLQDWDGLSQWYLSAAKTTIRNSGKPFHVLDMEQSLLKRNGNLWMHGRGFAVSDR